MHIEYYNVSDVVCSSRCLFCIQCWNYSNYQFPSCNNVSCLGSDAPTGDGSFEWLRLGKGRVKIAVIMTCQFCL